MLWVSAVVATVAIVILSRIDDWSRDLTTNRARTSDSSSLKPLRLSGSVDHTVERLRNSVADMPHWQWIDQSRTPQGGAVINLVRTTALFRFQDDVQVTIQRDDADPVVVVHVISRSRVGKGDLGQNPRNIKELLARLQNQ